MSVASFAVPLREIPDRTIRPGLEEGERCQRDDGQGRICQGTIEHLPDPDLGGCSCHISPPCNYCLSIMPECTDCGWRDDEP